MRTSLHRALVSPWGIRRGLPGLVTMGLLGGLACASPSPRSTPGVEPAATRPESHRPGDDPPEPAVDVVELAAADVQTGLAEGRFTAIQLTRAFLDRIARFEERYNAFVSLNPDALAIAARLDEEYRTRGPRGPLHGVPVVVKDNIDLEGQVTTAGFSGFSEATGGVDMIPGDDATVVERLEASGAIILGKTNLPDFAGHGTRTNSSVAGLTLNPYDVDRAPGGSSGGTATAVNASFAVLGLGTETGGSIQNPAAAQALVGVKPTFGLVSLEGVVPMSPLVDVVGPLARTVRDAAVVLDVLAGSAPEDPRTAEASSHRPPGGYAAALNDRALEGKRFGLVGEGWRDSFLPLAPETEALYQRAIEALIAQGAEVVADPFAGTDFQALYAGRRNVRRRPSDDLAAYLRGLGEDAAFNSVEEWEALTGQEFRRFGSRGRRGETDSTDVWTPPDRDPEANMEGESRSFQDWRAEIQRRFQRILAEHDLDGLFFPQAGAPIPDLIEDPQRPDYNPNNHPELPSNIVNDIGLPVVTLPFAYYDDGTPFVLAFIGNLWTEAELLSYAYDLEQAGPGRRAPSLRVR